MKPVGEPDAGDPHDRFDERGEETECCRTAQATAPLLDSTTAAMLMSAGMSAVPSTSSLLWPVAAQLQIAQNRIDAFCGAVLDAIAYLASGSRF